MNARAETTAGKLWIGGVWTAAEGGTTFEDRAPDDDTLYAVAARGGNGASGAGREGTEADIEAMTELKWITVNS